MMVRRSPEATRSLLSYVDVRPNTVSESAGLPSQAPSDVCLQAAMILALP